MTQLEQIYNFIKEYGEPVTSKDIAEGTGIVHNSVQTIIPKLVRDPKRSVKRNPAVIDGSKVYVYSFEKVKEEKADAPSNPMKNAEKYFDPTAGEAILNTTRKGKYPMRCSIGDIWSIDQRSFDGLIISMLPDDKMTFLLKCYKEKRAYMNASNHISFTAGFNTYYICITDICSSREENLNKKIGHINGEMVNLRRIFTETFKAMNDSVLVQTVEVEKPVEVIKEVIKEVEVPVEVVKEVKVESDPTEVAVLKEKVRIYERIIFGKEGL